MNKAQLLSFQGKKDNLELVIPVKHVEVMEDGEIVRFTTYDGNVIYYTFKKFSENKMDLRKAKSSQLYGIDITSDNIAKMKQWVKDAQRLDAHFLEKIREDLKIDNDVDFGKMCDYIKDLHARKNADYGDVFSQIFKKRGFNYAMGHLEEKMSRIDSISANGNKVIGEKLEDSLVDLACYALMTAIELRKTSK